MYSRTAIPRIASSAYPTSTPLSANRAINRLSSLTSHLATRQTQPSPIHYTQHRNLSTAKMPPVPSTMKAIVTEKTGGPEALEVRTSHPVPSAGEDQLLVRNKTIGINYIDTYFRTGLYPSPKPEILGREAIGTVVAVGPGANPYNFAVGDRVAWLSTGSYAEFSAVPQAKSIKVPEGLSDEDVMGSFLSGMTVLSFAKETYPVKKGDTVLLHAAAGGAGFLMTQILKDLGATVIGTAGGKEKVELVKSLGADHVIDYRSEEGRDWVKKVKEITNGRGVDVVYDSVGKDTWEGSLEAVARKGTIVWFGNASGPVPPLPLPKLSPKCVKVARPTLFGYIETREEFEFYVNALFDLLKSGKLKVKVHKTYPLDQVADAHRDLEGRKTTGKLLLSA